MPNRSIQLLALATALFGTVATVLVVSGLDARAARPDARTVLEAPVLLPTVVVRPEAEIPTLTEITVSPSRAERIAAGLEVTDDEDALETVAERVRASSRALLPGSGFGMPYYSFGKPLQRVNKE
jgi:hypothetical protein